jgi:hypothetical protein
VVRRLAPNAQPDVTYYLPCRVRVRVRDRDRVRVRVRVRVLLSLPSGTLAAIASPQVCYAMLWCPFYTPISAVSSWGWWLHATSASGRRAPATDHITGT